MKIKEFIKLCDKSQKIAILEGNRVIVNGKSLVDISYVSLSPLEDCEVKGVRTVDDVLEINLGNYICNSISYRDNTLRSDINSDLVINGNLRINGGKISVDGHECVLKNAVAISDCYNESLTADITNVTIDSTNVTTYTFNLEDCAYTTTYNPDFYNTTYSTITQAVDTTDNTTTVFELTCSCCGKKFKSLTPLQELCQDCLNDLADSESKAFE